MQSSSYFCEMDPLIIHYIVSVKEQREKWQESKMEGDRKYDGVDWCEGSLSIR